MRRYRFGVLAVALVWWAASVVGQSSQQNGEEATSWTFDTYTPGPCSATGARHGGCNPGQLVRIAVTTIAGGLVQPWHITFLPGTNDLLVTELPGRLRIIRNGVLDPASVPGWPVSAIPSRSLHTEPSSPAGTTGGRWSRSARSTTRTTCRISPGGGRAWRCP